MAARSWPKLSRTPSTRRNRKIVEDNQLRPAMQPKIDFPGGRQEIEQAFEAQADFAFTVALEVLPKIEVGGFEDIEIERLVADVSERRSRRGLERLAEQSRTYTPKEAERRRRNGDKATMDFTGKIDGEPFEGGSGENVDLVLGSGGFIPGFEAQLEGLEARRKPDNFGDFSRMITAPPGSPARRRPST